MNPNGNGELPPVTPPAQLKAPTAPIGASVPVGALTPRSENPTNEEDADTSVDTQTKAQKIAEAEAQAQKRAHEAALGKELEEHITPPTDENITQTMQSLAAPTAPMAGEEIGQDEMADNPVDEQKGADESDESSGASSTSLEANQNHNSVGEIRHEDEASDATTTVTAPDAKDNTDNIEPKSDTPETLDTTTSGTPPIEPDTAESTAGTSDAVEPAPTPGGGGEASPEPAPNTDNNPDIRLNTQPSSTAEKTPEEKLAEKIAELPEKLHEVINADPVLKKEYDQLQQQLISDEVQKTMNEMDKDKDGKSLQDRIDGARKNDQLVLAHVLEERQGRIKEIEEQAARQAALELIGKHPDNETLQNLIKVEKVDPAKVQEVLENAKLEADVRKQMASEELKAEKGRSSSIDNLAAEIDKAKQDKKPGTAMLKQEELNVVIRGLRADAMLNVVKETDLNDKDIREKAENRVRRILELSKRMDNPLARNPLLNNNEVTGQKTDMDAITALRQLAKREAVLAQEENTLHRLKGGITKRNRLDVLAGRIDEAAGQNKYSDTKNAVKYADAQETFEKMFAKEVANNRETAAINAINIFEKQESDKTLSTIARGDIVKIKEQLKKYSEKQKEVEGVSDEDAKAAEKQLNQKLRAYGRRWRHSWKNFIKPPDGETRGQAFKELMLSTRAVAGEGAKRFLIILGIWSIIQILAITAIEMRIAGKMFGQDGK